MSSALTESRRLALRSASRWYAVLSDGRVNPQQEARWQQWYEQNRDHQWAWQQVENLRQQMGQLPAPCQPGAQRQSSDASPGTERADAAGRRRRRLANVDQ